MESIDRSKIKFRIKGNKPVNGSVVPFVASLTGKKPSFTDQITVVPTVDSISVFHSDDIHLEARCYYGCIIKYCSHCKEYVQFYNESLWKELNGVNPQYEFDWDYLDLENGGWYLHVCKNSNVVAYLKNIVLRDIA